jgi:hypothetical protein
MSSGSSTSMCMSIAARRRARAGRGGRCCACPCWTSPASLPANSTTSRPLVPQPVQAARSPSLARHSGSRSRRGSSLPGRLPQPRRACAPRRQLQHCSMTARWCFLARGCHRPRRPRGGRHRRPCRHRSSHYRQRRRAHGHGRHCRTVTAAKATGEGRSARAGCMQRRHQLLQNRCRSAAAAR